MAINIHNLRVSNMTVGPLSGGGGEGGGGGGSSEPSYLAVGAIGVSSEAGAAYIYDATNYSATPTKLVPSGLNASDNFGISIAATSNQILVGAKFDDDQGFNAGAAYVYDATNLSATPTKLTPSGIGERDEFGGAVAATPNQLIIGAYGDDDRGSSAGAVYVYDASNLSATPTKLTPTGIGASDQFGRHNIAANSNHIVIGAIGDDDLGPNTGAVYVFDATNLSATPTKLTPSGLGTDDEFGYAMAVTSNHIVVGTTNDDDQGSYAGAVYVYDVNNLSATPTKLTPSGVDRSDYFGWSIAADSNYIAVGALYDEGTGNSTGAVYVFDATNLSATPTKLAPSGLDSNDRFGHSLSIQGSQLVVGAWLDDDQATNSGAVYVYDTTNLSGTPTKLTPSDGVQFGYSVSLG